LIGVFAATGKISPPEGRKAYTMRNKAFVFALAAAIIAFPASVLALPDPESGSVLTSDNISLAYDHYRNGFESVIIVCPGFYNSKDNRWMKKTAELLSFEHDVIVFDLRGHGSSGGKFMWTSREDADINAVLDLAKRLGYERIGVLAYSLGASSAINAVAGRDDVGSMVLISSPSRFQAIDFHFWEPGMLSDLFDNIACGWDGKGVRAGNMFLHKDSPIESIVKITDTPILFIHGDRDWIVKPRHSAKLYDAATSVKKIHIIKGGLHAERLIQFHYDVMSQLILDWFSGLKTSLPEIKNKNI
jgi:pimeloyl-ACP methyl ester carboxylesterase